MHPTLMQEVARYRQADMRREAARARHAHQVSLESKSDEAPQRARLSLRRRAVSFGRPVLGH
jgi:hypothetical protein